MPHAFSVKFLSPAGHPFFGAGCGPKLKPLGQEALVKFDRNSRVSTFDLYTIRWWDTCFSYVIKVPAGGGAVFLWVDFNTSLIESNIGKRIAKPAFQFSI